MAQKHISTEKLQDSATATENNGHIEDESAQVNEADDAVKGNAQPGTDRQEPRTPENPVSRSISREEEQIPDSLSKDVKSKITMLLVVIDQIDSDFKQARELILEIAKRLDEGRLCERNEISRTLKKILKDKIQTGKVTEKWIEECLPPEYKRTYVKSELRSLSKERPKRQLIGVGTEGKQVLLVEGHDGKGIDRSTKGQPSNKIESENKLKQKQAGELEENEELKEVVGRQGTMQSLDQVSKSELQCIVPKPRYNDLRHSMDESENLIYLIFDKSRTFVRARPDIFDSRSK
ncbi:MAG: hypothetical protein WBZ36_22025 [Candidatus Nitrosopolaris sp.]